MRRIERACALVLVVCSLALGCSGGDGGRERVRGHVKFKGQPLDQGTIQFWPESEGANFEGTDIKDGAYEIPATKGLLPGKYRVRIFSGDPREKEEAAPGESGPPAKERIPARFNADSAEVREVKKGGPNEFDFDIPAK
jgi:hypothetical protein